ncbi:hypothetical protein C3941_23800 [Kaistia algarum]|uniref:hypothetical protein n=1 Tax=Kaistia algarum TaxID=2083279 RepID=UPI000CE77A3B|nr:hypothetical protein [Kaistia algarum]MCX5513416.1 hypothetical protein [Kaistia algarum]PPE77423.1 hypothetical protein C3941_23800 [Kaistia algarum]
MPICSIKILVRLDFPSGAVRLVDGAGPYMDVNGDIWSGAGALVGLDQIEQALNGEAATLGLSLSAPIPELIDLAWQDDAAGDVVGSVVQILIQPCDEYDQPDGAPDVKFTGAIDDISFDDGGQGESYVASVSIAVTNRFTLRNLTNGAVLSDVDQKARSAILNPGAAADEIAERVPLLLDHTIVWPRFTT